MHTNQPSLAIRMGLPLVLVGAAAMTAQAFDTSWIAPGQTISAEKLKAALDDTQTRIVTLESERVARAVITSTGTLISESGTWISRIDHPGTGSYVVHFAAGTFASTPTCVATPYTGSQVPPGVEGFNRSEEEITLAVSSSGAGAWAPSSVDISLGLICIGPRP